MALAQVTLEHRIAGRVNEAYGLTAEDVDLVWRTAPPRLPVGRDQPALLSFPRRPTVVQSEEPIVTLVHPPKLVFDDRGALVEVIVSADDFRTYLRAVSADTPWDELPEPWQDAVDRLLIEEVAGERTAAVDLDDLLAASDT